MESLNDVKYIEKKNYKKYIFTEEQQKDIVEMYRKDIYVSDIAKKYDVCKGTIYKVLKSNNIELCRYNPTLEDNLDDIINRYINGESTNSISIFYNTTNKRILKLLKENHVSIRDTSHAYRRYEIDETFFDVIDTQEKAYILGLLWADGCNKTYSNTITLGLQAGDKKILEDINLIMQSNRPLRFERRKNNNCQDQYILSITNKHISEILDQLGLCRAKSLVLKFPEWLDISLYPHFIRGVFDGDGSIASDSHHHMSIVGTNDFCVYLNKYLKNIGIESVIYDTKRNDITKELKINRKHDCKKFFDYIYKDATIYLERKYLKYISKYCKNINNTLTA